MMARGAAFFTGVASVNFLWAMHDREWPWAALFALSAVIFAARAWLLPSSLPEDDR